MTVEMIEELGEALNRRDMVRAIEFFTDDCVYMPSAGIEQRRAYHGREAVRAGLSNFLTTVVSGRFEPVQIVIAGDRGFEEWHFIGTAADGREIDVHGCDYYEFRGDKVVVKNCFRKVP
jgi:ketosteroid isomerase-like protein